MALYLYIWSEKPNEAFISESFSSMRMTRAKQDEISSHHLAARGIVLHCCWDIVIVSIDSRPVFTQSQINKKATVSVAFRFSRGKRCALVTIMVHLAAPAIAYAYSTWRINSGSTHKLSPVKGRARIVVHLLEIHELSFLLHRSFLQTESDTNIFTSRFCWEMARETPFPESLRACSVVAS